VPRTPGEFVEQRTRWARAGLPIFMLELALTHPSYRQNVVTFALLYAAGGAVPLVISLPFAVKYRNWRSIAWIPTWFAYAFLCRLGTLEATISLPTRPLLAGQHAPLPRLAVDTVSQ
jgi:cellulose synthase/poly-beta-1,6-N-acetylglucosamine synthase-like glycosyltransferase